MSTEPERADEGWTINTLHMHLDRQILDLKAMLSERHADHNERMDERHEAAQEAVRTAFERSEKAIDKRQEMLDKEFREHLEQVRHENALAFVNADKVVQANLASAKEAVAKAEASTEKRFEAANGFRAQLADQAATFMTRAEANAVQIRNSERVDDLTDRMNRNDGAKIGINSHTTTLIAILSVVIISINVGVAIFAR